MFSLIFPGQGSQTVGMGKEFYEKFDRVKNIFNKADEVLNFPIKKLILEGPKDQLDLTENTQPAIFLVGYSIFTLLTKEFAFDDTKVKFFAGHSLGEYTALTSAGFLNFDETLAILKKRGQAMQSSVPKGEGGMIAVLGSKIEFIENLLEENASKYECFIANDNSEGQIVLSGKTEDLDKLIQILKNSSIKNIKLPVSAPFHCDLMNNATKIMIEELNKLSFKNGQNKLISNVTANEIKDLDELKNLLIKQIENRVRWRESVINMIENDVDHFIEIGPGKVLSGLVKRINRNIKIDTINFLSDIESLKI
jgi:[acyl-carrier-protein] S-malonyltransferase